MAEEEFLFCVAEDEFLVCVAEDEFLVWEDEEVLFWVAEEEFRVCVAEEEFLVWVADLELLPELLWPVADDDEPLRDEEDAEELRVAVPEEFLCWVELL